MLAGQRNQAWFVGFEDASSLRVVIMYPWDKRSGCAVSGHGTACIRHSFVLCIFFKNHGHPGPTHCIGTGVFLGRGCWRENSIFLGEAKRKCAFKISSFFGAAIKIPRPARDCYQPPPCFPTIAHCVKNLGLPPPQGRKYCSPHGPHATYRRPAGLLMRSRRQRVSRRPQVGGRSV